MAFTRFTKNVLNVSALPDRVQNQAQTLKATFDQAGVDIKAALNALIAELEASTSADNIGADVQSVATKTVQAVLTTFEEAIADRYTKTEAETLLAEGTNSLVSDIDVNLTTGVITITKKDGTVETFDTAIEKVPARFEVVENNGAYALKITNVDGTTTQADITNFMNIYTFNNSDYITFETAGTGTEKVVTANIKANSIGLDKLSLSVVTTLEGYVNSARDSATAAKTSETNARASELNALEAKNTAVAKANEASASASAAKTSETNAEYWAKQAQSSGGGGGGITEIPIASADTLGGIKVGEGLEITEDGVLSALGGGSGTSGKITALYEGEFLTQDSSLTLNDNIRNYDILIVNTFLKSSAGHKQKTNNTIVVDQITYVGVEEYYGYSNTQGTTMQYSYSVRFGFDVDGTTLLVGAINKGTGYSANDIGIDSVYGIKLGGGSGGNIKVLEASTDNVIDFNTLTEEGIYLIKNCSNGAGTTLNGYYSVASYTLDAILEVITTKKVGTGEVTKIYQHLTYGARATKVTRTYEASKGTWTEWVSTLPQIQYSTTDLTAGTSALTTGNIYLVYE